MLFHTTRNGTLSRQLANHQARNDDCRSPVKLWQTSEISKNSEVLIAGHLFFNYAIFSYFSPGVLQTGHLPTNGPA
jgi:hypothetical protein